MSAAAGDDTSSLERKSFLTTRWSVVRAAGAKDSAEAREALASLCEGYWYPLYAFVRRQGLSSHDARDLTQAFFARLLEKRDLGGADPAQGRFRAFLLGALKHFLANERDRARALKRGGGAPGVIAIDARDADSRFELEASDLTPEQAYERNWALALLERTLALLREEHAAQGKAELFAALEGTISGQADAEARRGIAERLRMTPGALDVAVHRLRRRYKERLRAEIAQTVSDPGEVEEELRDLFGALGN